MLVLVFLVLLVLCWCCRRVPARSFASFCRAFVPNPPTSYWGHQNILFLNFLQRFTKGYKVHFQSLLLSLDFLANKIMEFTSAWNLQCNDFIHKRRPKKHRKLDHCNDEEASVGFDVLMMKLVLMLVLRNRVCLFSVATLISGPAYGGRWWATILNALSSSSSSPSASSSSSLSSSIFCQMILLPWKQCNE